MSVLLQEDRAPAILPYFGFDLSCTERDRWSQKESGYPASPGSPFRPVLAKGERRSRADPQLGRARPPQQAQNSASSPARASTRHDDRALLVAQQPAAGIGYASCREALVEPAARVVWRAGEAARLAHL